MKVDRPRLQAGHLAADGEGATAKRGGERGDEQGWFEEWWG